MTNVQYREPGAGSQVRAIACTTAVLLWWVHSNTIVIYFSDANRAYVCVYPPLSSFGQASINTLLNRVGISAKPINSFEELRKSASSMFVAIFEAMFQVRQVEFSRICACRNLHDGLAWLDALRRRLFPQLSACRTQRYLLPTRHLLLANFGVSVGTILHLYSFSRACEHFETSVYISLQYLSKCEKQLE